MTLEQLRIFVGVAEREHVTAGARALNVTQSAASAAIAALERRHDVRLFHRVGRGIELTEAGSALLAAARDVLSRAAAAETMLDEFGSLERGSLRVVASQTIAAYWLPPILAAYRRRHPGVVVDLSVGNTEQSARRVREGGADLGIVEGVVEDDVLSRWRLAEDRLVVVAAEPPRGLVDAAWLSQARWIMREQGSGTRSSLIKALAAIGVDAGRLEVALSLPSNEGVRTAVESGAGIAALSSLVVSPALRSGRLHAVPLDLGSRPFYGLRHRERYRARAADALLALIGAMDGGSIAARSSSAGDLT